MATYSYSGTIQKVTVGTSGTFDITAYGASGGASSGLTGGAGAEVGGDFALTAGERLEIVVGGAGAYGQTAPGSGDGGGGGGGSFVLASTDGGASYHLLLAAGGGGGAYHINGVAAYFLAADAGSGAGGVGGGGSSGPNGGTTAFLSGGGGSGYNGDGVSFAGRAGGGSNRTGAYAGGAQASPGLGYTGHGGFGGGGGGNAGGGGGGGYSGGAGGYYVGGGRNTGGGGGGTSKDNGTPLVAQSAATENAANTGNGEVVITPDAVCFYAGTRIRTPTGEVAVETLKPGDWVVTADGRATQVNWLGVQSISTRFADPARVLPIRIKAGALGENMPCRDLVLSPDHALFLDGMLLQASALVNDDSIFRETYAPEVFNYYHIETDQHELILAESTPAETFIDNVDRLAFDNWEEHQALHAEGKEIRELPYPRAKSHRQVPMHIRAWLAERAKAIRPRFAAAA